MSFLKMKPFTATYEIFKQHSAQTVGAEGKDFMVLSAKSTDIKNWHYVHVEVTSKGFPDIFDGTIRIEKFNCIVAFPSTRPHNETIKDYLRAYHGINTDTDTNGHVQMLLTDPSCCAKALAVYYFREKPMYYLEAHTDSRKDIMHPPSFEPEKVTENMAIWVNNDETVQVDSEHTVAIYLSDVIRDGGKISVDTAKRLIQDKFGSRYRLDSNVLAAFSEIDGKYTKKYLRL